MREHASRHVMLVSPAPGFTGRVMVRIQERDQRAARQRAIVGACLLGLAGAIPLLLGGILLFGALTDVLSYSDWLTPGIISLTPTVNLIGTVLAALWLGGTAVLAFGSGELVVYALVVLALTLLWTRAAGGSFQLVPHTIDMGGSE